MTSPFKCNYIKFEKVNYALHENKSGFQSCSTLSYKLTTIALDKDVHFTVGTQTGK